MMRSFAFLFGILFLLTADAENVNSIDDTWRTADNVVDFQLYADVFSASYTDANNHPVEVKWTNLNRNINSWYLMEVSFKGGWGDNKKQTLNIENNIPDVQTLSLMSNGTINILNTQTQAVVNCNILGTTVSDGEAFAGLGKDPYMSLCGGLISLRNRQDGRKDWVAWGSTALRSVLGEVGDDIVNSAKENIFSGEFLETGDEVAGDGAVEQRSLGAPASALVKADSGAIKKHQIGFKIAENTEQGLDIGRWYPAQNYDGVYVSVMKPKFVADDILKTFTDRVNGIDGNEGNALVVSMAMDLSNYSVGWDNGTEHPGVGWSPRPQVPHKGSGPDGFGNLSPLEFPGVINPVNLKSVVGTFAGGFQRMHSAFKWGPYSSYNRGHHYGFMEKGVLMSTIVPNLATFINYKDGSIEIKTWTPADNANMDKMRDIRQNGVPLIENGEPGLFVNKWGPGNWSGSAEKLLKTPRTSACILESNGKKFLVVSYFSTHTPSSMARVLQSYGCSYAIHLDMNSPKFAYAAFFTQNDKGGFDIEHLSDSMSDEDVKADGVESPRSILTPTYKDFFYVMKKK
jgi:hypothetical protein